MQFSFPIGAVMNSISLPIVLLMVSIPTIASGQTSETTTADDPTRLAKAIDAILESSFAIDQPGVSVIVVKQGQTIYESARGMAELELQVPMAPNMVFRIGSITKQFTAAAIMLLVEEGKISLTDEITKFLPNYPTQGTKINVEHLLTHTSGIRSYTGMPGWMETKIVNPMTVQEIIDGFKNEPMDFKPGEKFRYNNSGYILLGAIIEKASGQPYADFIQQRIFDPLGMSHSYYGKHDAIIENRVAGYGGTLTDPKNAKYLSMTQPYAAGSLLSTVQDLGKWNKALFAGKVVSRESLARMVKDYKLSDGSLAGYGYGLRPGFVRGRKSISHGGGIFGFVCHGIYLADDDIYVALLCNSTSHNPSRTGNQIAALVAGDPYREFKAISVDKEKLKRFVGVYKIDEETRRHVTLENGQLFTMRDGGSRLAAIPSSETAFFYKTTPSHFEFVIDDNDKVTGMQMYQEGSKEANFAKRVDEELLTERKIAKVEFAIYDDYVGEYELTPGFSITVTRDKNHLMAQGTGQAKFEIFPSSETVFFPKVVDAELTFVRDKNNNVNQIVLKQGGAELKGTRK